VSIGASQKGHFRLFALSQLTVSLITLPHFKHVISSGKLSKNIVVFTTIRHPLKGGIENSVKTICHRKPRAVDADSVCNHGAGHAMAYSAAVQPKIHRYLNSLQVSGLESPLPKRCNRCLIQHLMPGALEYVYRCHRSIRTNIAHEKTRTGPMALPCLERILWPRRVERVMLGLFCVRL
jgi:hypothetical protein